FSRIREMFDRTFWESLGLPEGIAGIAALAYALAAFFVTPDAREGPVVTGAYAPLMILTLGGALALLVWMSIRGRTAMGKLTERAKPSMLALFVASGSHIVAGLFLIPLVTAALLKAIAAAGSGLTLATMVAVEFVLVLLGLLGARAICERVGVRIF